MGTQRTSKGSEDAVRNAIDSIRHLVRALRLTARAAEKMHGMSAAQVFVLQKLRDEPALSIGELAARTSTDQSSVSVVAKRLIDAGYVARKTSAEDARRVELTLTAQGRRIVAKMPAPAQEQLIESVEKLSARDRKLLAELLHKVVAGMGIETEGTAPMFFEDGVERKRRKTRK